MKDQYAEKLSAWVDGELDEAEVPTLLDRLSSDPTLRQHWRRYHMIGDAIDNHLPPLDLTGFAERVSAALDHEPTVLAPKRWRFSIGRRWLKPVASMAVAASVSAVAIVALQNHYDAGQAAPAPTVAEAGRALPPSVTLASDDNETPVPADVRQRLNVYLVDHSEYTSMNGLQGSLSFRRIATTGAMER